MLGPSPSTFFDPVGLCGLHCFTFVELTFTVAFWELGASGDLEQANTRPCAVEEGGAKPRGKDRGENKGSK